MHICFEFKEHKKSESLLSPWLCGICWAVGRDQLTEGRTQLHGIEGWWKGFPGGCVPGLYHPDLCLWATMVWTAPPCSILPVDQTVETMVNPLLSYGCFSLVFGHSSDTMNINGIALWKEISRISPHGFHNHPFLLKVSVGGRGMELRSPGFVTSFY